MSTSSGDSKSKNEIDLGEMPPSSSSMSSISVSTEPPSRMFVVLTSAAALLNLLVFALLMWGAIPAVDKVGVVASNAATNAAATLQTAKETEELTRDMHGLLERAERELQQQRAALAEFAVVIRRLSKALDEAETRLKKLSKGKE